MKLWLWIFVLIIVIEIAAMPSKKAPKDRKQSKSKELARTHRNKAKRKGKQSKGIFSPKGKIGRLWMKAKRPVKRLYNKAFWTLARFFNGKRSYTWRLFGKRIRIVMPRMPRSWKETKKQIAAIRKAIRRNPRGRCLAAICVNIAVFTIGYTILFIYNIYYHFRFKQAQAAEKVGTSIFKDNGSRRYEHALIRGTKSAIKQKYGEEPTGQTKTVLQEDVEVIREADGEGVTTASSPDAAKNNVDLLNENDAAEYVKGLEAGILSARSETPESAPSQQTPSIARKASFEEVSPTLISTPEEKDEDLKERLLAVPEIFDDSDKSSVDTSHTSSLRRRGQRTSGEETKRLLSVDDNNDILSASYQTPVKHRTNAGSRFSSSEGDRNLLGQYVRRNSSKTRSTRGPAQHATGPNPMGDDDRMRAIDEVLENRNQGTDDMLTKDSPI